MGHEDVHEPGGEIGAGVHYVVRPAGALPQLFGGDDLDRLTKLGNSLDAGGQHFSQEPRNTAEVIAEVAQ